MRKANFMSRAKMARAGANALPQKVDPGEENNIKETKSQSD